MYCSLKCQKTDLNEASPKSIPALPSFEIKMFKSIFTSLEIAADRDLAAISALPTPHSLPKFSRRNYRTKRKDCAAEI